MSLDFRTDLVALDFRTSKSISDREREPGFSIENEPLREKAQESEEEEDRKC